MKQIFVLCCCLLTSNLFSQSQHVPLLKCEVFNSDLQNLTIFYPGHLLENKDIKGEHGLLMVTKKDEEVHLHQGRLEINQKESTDDEQKDYELSMSLPKFSKRGGIIIDINMDERFKGLTKKQVPGMIELFPFDKEVPRQKVKMACTRMSF